jgi:hypothetical protein
VNAIVDTSIVIDLQMGLLARALPGDEYLLAVISEFELRSFHGLVAESQLWLNAFLSDFSIVETEVVALYWTGWTPEVVNSGRVGQGSASV